MVFKPGRGANELFVLPEFTEKHLRYLNLELDLESMISDFVTFTHIS